MVFSYYLYKYPYWTLWKLVQLFKKNPELAVYCADPLDYVVLKPAIDHLPEAIVVAKNGKTARYLKTQGIAYRRMPSFPRAVVMCRHAAHKFPVQEIIKIGFRHGAYHFKAFAKSRYFNSFDCYFVTSKIEEKLAREHGITTAVAIGFPKLDPLFDGTFDEARLNAYKKLAKIDSRKHTIFFSATWDKSGMSAIETWINQLQNLNLKYNILVTVHPWMSKKYTRKLRSMEGIFFIENPDVLPYLLIADIMVGDTSSILAEFCVLDKPIITFKTKQAKRSDPELEQLIQQFSARIESFDELQNAIEFELENPGHKSSDRQNATKIMFDDLSPAAGKKAADQIQLLLELILTHKLGDMSKPN
ncbi:CDP-glycerol glycerophosphotransferase family protein [candidate division KSB1 bacterium]|nr:CDP-glycerol glycerophosphotransferase family protein [candidate division KSB1 bacterium]